MPPMKCNITFKTIREPRIHALHGLSSDIWMFLWRRPYIYAYLLCIFSAPSIFVRLSGVFVPVHRFSRLGRQVESAPPPLLTRTSSAPLPCPGAEVIAMRLGASAACRSPAAGAARLGAVRRPLSLLRWMGSPMDRCVQGELRDLPAPLPPTEHR